MAAHYAPTTALHCGIINFILNQYFRVCHLAGKFVTHLNEKLELEKEELDKLREKEPEPSKKEELKKLKEDMPSISETDIMCVKMAGLCHDLGRY